MVLHVYDLKSQQSRKFSWGTSAVPGSGGVPACSGASLVPEPLGGRFRFCWRDMSAPDVQVKNSLCRRVCKRAFGGHWLESNQKNSAAGFLCTYDWHHEALLRLWPRQGRAEALRLMLPVGASCAGRLKELPVLVFFGGSGALREDVRDHGETFGPRWPGVDWCFSRIVQVTEARNLEVSSCFLGMFEMMSTPMTSATKWTCSMWKKSAVRPAIVGIVSFNMPEAAFKGHHGFVCDPNMREPRSSACLVGKSC